MNNKFLQYALLFLVLSILGCSDDEPKNKEVPVSTGFFIVNEGAFGAGNASLSFYSDQDEAVSNDVFLSVNEIPLGDQAQSMSIVNGAGFIVVQNSSKVEVIDVDSWENIATITNDISSPRYVVGNGSKAYLSDWGPDGVTGSVKVINADTYEVEKSIPVGSGPNQMLIVGDRLYVTNVGGFSVDNTLSVIDLTSETVVDTFQLSFNPNSLAVDANGDLWVASSGFLAFDADFNIDVEQSIPGAIEKISTSGDILFQFAFEGLGGPSQLQINPENSEIFYLYSGQIYRITDQDSTLPAAPINENSYYGFSLDSEEQLIIGCVAPDFSSAGYIEFLSFGGNVNGSYDVGIAPNSCVFK